MCKVQQQSSVLCVKYSTHKSWRFVNNLFTFVTIHKVYSTENLQDLFINAETCDRNQILKVSCKN